jgi:hypothetical protein
MVLSSGMVVPTDRIAEVCGSYDGTGTFRVWLGWRVKIFSPKAISTCWSNSNREPGLGWSNRGQAAGQEKEALEQLPLVVEDDSQAAGLKRDSLGEVRGRGRIRQDDFRFAKFR